MGIVFAGIAPHGFPLIPELSVDADGALATRNALIELGRRFIAALPEVIVIAGPHGVRVEGMVALAGTDRAAGTLAWDGRRVDMNIPIDQQLTDSVADHARERGVPVAITGFGGNRRDGSVLPLDWGMLVPLWFLGQDQNIPGSGDVLAEFTEIRDGLPVVLVSPSRSLPHATLVEFGHAIAEAAATDGRRVAFIASCDWAHTHVESGPYGFHPLATEFDARVVDLVARNALDELVDIPYDDANAVAMDGLWQALMLNGVLQSVPMPVEFHGYEAPTYYGMLVASWSAI